MSNTRPRLASKRSIAPIVQTEPTAPIDASVEPENVLPVEPEKVQTAETRQDTKVVSYKMTRAVERAVKYWAISQDLEFGEAAEHLLWLGLRQVGAGEAPSNE